MLLEILKALATVSLASAIIHMVLVVLCNRRAHQFFKINSPNLPVAPNPGWIGGHALELLFTGRNWLKMHEYHAKFGKNFGGFYRNNPAISTTDLDLIKRMVIDEPDKHINRPILDVPIDEIEIDSVPYSEDDQWRRIRKAVAPAFASHKIKSANVQAEVRSVIDKFVASIERRLDKRGGSIEVDADNLFHRYALALVFTCFYKQDDVIDFDAERDEFVDSVVEGFVNFDSIFTRFNILFPALKPITKLAAIHLSSLGKIRTRIVNYIQTQTRLNQQAQKTIDAAKRTGGEIDEDNVLLKSGQKFRRNMIDYITDQFNLGKLTAREYLHSTYFLFFAANKTSADALTKIFYLLAAHQEVQDKLRKVIFNEGSEGEYVNWVILEAMRVYPPALIGCTRTITSDFRTHDGHLVPAGTIVLTPAFTIHRLKEYWGEDADEFRPERWANSKDFHPCQYLAFGAGKRNCPGRDFAMHEMRLLVTELMMRFKFDPSDKSQGFLMFSSPALIFTVSDEPTYLKISCLGSQ